MLFGHHFAAISGAGPLIGPVLAIQFGYLPGLVWLVVGVCLAGAVQDMMVLAASTRRGGLSLAGLARTEIGRPAGLAAAIAILYIVIIALAGLGIVVVKALGGEEVPHEGRDRADLSRRIARSRAACIAGGPTDLQGPARARPTDSATGPSRPWSSTRRSTWPCPRGSMLKLDPHDQGLGLARQTPGGWCPGSSWGTFTIACTIPIALFVGWYMYRFRKGKVLEASLLGARCRAGRDGRRGVLIPGSQLEPYFSLSRDATVFALAAYGFVAAVLPVWLLLCPRDYLSTLPQDRHDLAAGRRRHHRQPQARGARGQPVLRLGRRPLLRRADLSLCLHLHHVRGDLGLSRPGLLGHDAQDGRPRERRPDDRLRRDADGGAGRAWSP